MGTHWRNLKVWQKTHELVLKIYRLTQEFPKHELYGVADQLKRAACSVPANIVEGQSRNTTREYLQFLFNARGSIEEVRYFLLLSKDLGFATAEDYETLETDYESASKMLNGLIRSLKSTTTLNP
jgi:four helix bundle protein